MRVKGNIASRSDARRHVVVAMCDDEEYEAVEALKAAWRMPIAVIVRSLIWREARSIQGQWTSDESR